MKNARFLTFALALSLGACCHYKDDLSSLDAKMAAPATQTAMAASPADIAPAAGAPATQTLSQDLAREYYDLAKYENDKAYDYKASAFYTKQAMASSQGKIVTPSKVSSYDIPDSMKPELTNARSELIGALKGVNTPENAATLAKAQARYECWLERAEEATDPSHYETCKSEFESAIASLTMPAAGGTAPTIYDIIFGANTAIIDPNSLTTVDLITQFLNDPKNAGYTANLTGYGVGGNNDTLSASRVGTLRDALVTRGVDAAKLKPLVAPMGVESTNKVQVALIAPDVVTPEGTKTTTYEPITPKPVDTIPQGAIVVPAPAPAVVPAPAPVTPAK